MTTPFEGIVIGVDGSPGCSAAVRAGVQKARRLGLPVRLVHVVPDYLPMSPLVAMSAMVLTETGCEILGHAADEAVTLASDLAMETELRHGHRAIELAASAVGADTLFVGTDARIGVDRLLRGNTPAGLAVRASCPVEVVPADWDESSRGVVVAGVKSDEHSGEVVDTAFAEAEKRGAKLILLHAWKLPGAYDDIITSRVAAEEWTERATAEIESLIAGHRATYPAVEVESRVVHLQTAKALVAASLEADLLVVGRRSHLGGVARAVLRHAHCPILVVPPAGASPAPVVLADLARTVPA
jgi:nucleotide-binding universal stress UspA family protein